MRPSVQLHSASQTPLPRPAHTELLGPRAANTTAQQVVILVLHLQPHLKVDLATESPGSSSPGPRKVGLKKSLALGSTGDTVKERTMTLHPGRQNVQCGAKPARGRV